MRFLRNIRIGIKNLYRWFPIIWNDRDWDHNFFFEIMRFKLKNMENFFRYYGCHLVAEKDADKMKVCIILLDRLIEDRYFDNAFKPHDKKWGESKMRLENNGKLEIDYPNVKTDEDKINQNIDFKKGINLEGYLIKQDLKYSFNILEKNITQGILLVTNCRYPFLI